MLLPHGMEGTYIFFYWKDCLGEIVYIS
jgi:hypothetical protein